MKKKILVILLLLVAIVALYLNRSYAHIYSSMGRLNLQSPDVVHGYTLGNENDPTLTYVALGDSFTAGVGLTTYDESYPYLVAQKISKQHTQVDLKIFAVPGVRSAGIDEQILDSIIKTNPNIITIFVGVNDIHGFVSAKEFKKNYERILTELTQKTSAKIYIINIPYIGAPGLIIQPYSYYFSDRTKEFNALLKNLAQTYDTEYVDIYTPTLASSGEKDFYSLDLFHPSDVGYSLWADIIYDNLNF